MNLSKIKQEALLYTYKFEAGDNLFCHEIMACRDLKQLHDLIAGSKNLNSDKLRNWLRNILIDIEPEDFPELNK